ncbi:sugar-binding domain-containing protein [Rhodovulum kholense]|nr:sugar-binding domain-containing protein [Rhodovulum kholense]
MPGLNMVAGGQRQQPAVLACLKARFVNTRITDSRTADLFLKAG